MIDRIIHFSIHHKLVVSVMVAALIGWGIYSMQHLSINAVPDITDNQVQVITNAPTLAAQEVEQLITYPLEMSLGNIPSVLEIRSVSRFGLSVITVVFQEEVDIYLARQLIGERIKVASEDIPDGLGQPEMAPITTGLGEIYQYVLHPAPGYEDRYSATDLRSLQDWLVKRQLTGIEGVVEINSSGGYLKQYEVAYDPDKLNSMGVTLDELYQAVDQNNANTGGSYIEREHYTYFIRGEGRLKSEEDIANVVVKTVGGLPILVNDVARVRIGHAPRFGAVTMNGKGEVVAGQVLMLKGANSAEVTERVKNKMTQIQASLPQGVIIEPYLDRSKLVDRTTRTVITNLIEGGLIVIFVLVLLLGNLRAGLIVASVIPLSMLFAFSMMHIFGISANLMSLGAIDFGLIVDGAVIVVEAILHHLGFRKAGLQLSRQEMDQEVFTAASRIRRSAAFGEIIILIVYVPILFLSGIEGKMFRPMAQTVGFAIFGALILSLTYVPMMSALFLQRQVRAKKTIADRIMGFIYRLYRPVLQFSLRMKWFVLALTVAIFIYSLWIFSRMGGEFIPTLEEGDFALHQILPPGSSLAQGVEVSAHLQNILLEKFPEVEKVVTKIGTAEIPTDIMPLEAGDIYVILKPKEDWTSAKDREGLFEKMEEELDRFPGVTYEFTQPIQMRFNELMTGIRQDIAVKIYGEDLGLLVQKAEAAKRIIETIEGAGDIQVEPTAGLQQMVARYNWSKMAKYGVSAETLNRVIRTSFAGENAGYIFENEKKFELVLRLDEANRKSIDDLRNVFIPLENGSQIPLSEVAEVNFEEGPTQISRDNTQRRITIGVNARGRDVESLVTEIEAQLNAGLNLPSGYYLTFGGQFENLQNARKRLRVAVPVALILIFILLYFTFGSVWQSLLIYTAIPMSAIGGIWALYLRGMPFSISAGVGFIALFGVAVLNGIVLLSYFNRLKKEGMIDVWERIFTGTRLRLRPVIMTASVASLGFLPMAVSTSAGAEVQQPLATVVIGGLISATFLTLIVLPILYWLVEKTKAVNGKMLAVLLLLLPGGTALAQVNPISLEDAIAKAQLNYPSIRVHQRQLEQATLLQNIRPDHPNANVFITGEEFDFSQQSGVHSIGITQNFSLPKVNRALRQVYQEEVNVVRSQIDLTRQELAYKVSKSYYEVLFQKSSQDALQELIRLYVDLEQVSQARFEAGETGKMPVMNAQTKQWEARLLDTQLQMDRQIALANFNLWLGVDTLYEPLAAGLPDPVIAAYGEIDRHPLIQYHERQQLLAGARVELNKSQLIPQISSGFRLQTVDGTAPFFGYQLGVNVPLFRGAIDDQIEAAELQVEIHKAQKDLIYLQLERQQELEKLKIEKQAQTIAYYRDRLLVHLRSQQELGRIAYRQGEINYLEYTEIIQNLIQYQLSYLVALKEYHFLRINLMYLINN